MQLAHMMNDVENVLLDVLEERVQKNESIPSYRTAQGLTFQIITKTAFAMDIDSQRNEDVRTMQILYKILILLFAYAIFF